MKNVEDLPDWVRPTLQGIAFWMGHRRCFYRSYPLTEGAMVAEVCNLLYANLNQDYVLECEVQISKLLETPQQPNADVTFQRARADLVISEKRDLLDDAIPKFVIEVKRGSASKGQIDADLKRLATICAKKRSIRGFLFVISEASRPARFVTDEGVSVKGNQNIPGTEWFYRVRRVYKAAHAYKSKDTAQYACVLEVFTEKTRAPRKR